MTQLELIKSKLEEMGYKPKFDDDGDLKLVYQMKSLYFFVGDEDEKFVNVLLPQFADVEEGEETLVLTVCNKMTREIKLAKVYIDRTLKNVSAGTEFFYTDEDCLVANIKHSLSILGMIRSSFHRTKRELAE